MSPSWRPKVLKPKVQYGLKWNREICEVLPYPGCYIDRHCTTRRTPVQLAKLLLLGQATKALQIPWRLNLFSTESTPRPFRYDKLCVCQEKKVPLTEKTGTITTPHIRLALQTVGWQILHGGLRWRPVILSCAEACGITTGFFLAWPHQPPVGA